MQGLARQIEQLAEGNYENVREFLINVAKKSPAEVEEIIYNAKRIFGRLPEQQRNRKKEIKDE